MNERDNLPRIFQANVDRLFQRVILTWAERTTYPRQAALRRSPVDGGVPGKGQGTRLTTAREPKPKAYALILAGLFERQLRIWARSRRTGLTHDKVRSERFRVLVVDCAREAEVDLVDKRLGHVLIEMFPVANVFRHGDGPSLTDLRSHSPELWDYERSRYVDLLPPNPDDSEKLLLQPPDVVRYAAACARFWGRADKLVGAVADPPYG